MGEEKHLLLQLGVRGVMVQGLEDIVPIALIRASQSRRVLVVKVEKKSGLDQVLIFILLDRALHQVFIRVSVKAGFDLYLDEYGNKMQA